MGPLQAPLIGKRGSVVVSGGGSGQPDLAGLNVLVDSRDLTTENWTSTVGVRAYNQIGLGGEANTASLITDSSTGYEGIWNQTSSHASMGPAQRISHRIFIKQDTTNNRFPFIEFIGYGDDAFAAAAVSIGTAVSGTYPFAGLQLAAAGINPSAMYQVASSVYPGWWEIGVELTPVVSMYNSRINISPTRGTVLGQNLPAPQGSIIVGNAEVFLDMPLWNVMGQAAVFT